MRRPLIIFAIVAIIVILAIALFDDNGGSLGPMFRALGSLLRLL
jgi:hypothetical protein